jgi:hypothetical protein
MNYKQNNWKFILPFIFISFIACNSEEDTFLEEELTTVEEELTTNVSELNARSLSSRSSDPHFGKIIMNGTGLNTYTKLKGFSGHKSYRIQIKSDRTRNVNIRTVGSWGGYSKNSTYNVSSSAGATTYGVTEIDCNCTSPNATTAEIKVHAGNNIINLSSFRETEFIITNRN